MQSVEISAFAPTERDAVTALIVKIQQDEFGIAITAQDQPDLRDIPGFYHSGAGGFWVAKLDGGIIGTIALKDIGEGQGALRKMFVAEQARGRELGVAAKLLGRLLEEARRSGITQIYLGTTDKFLAAHRFYEKNGFAEVEKETLPKRFPVMAVDTKFYCISLK
ncbi:GNAT family N-acetyltransferase [Agrobacterium sp.]|jgi:N-acetylglutamate synthase-like GNAT family acetyltransferase|uniref:GNAT family N-acetyltransferase n=1 Tax=Agrobacterium sp. TaxID=361 RepID=UPI0028ABE0B3